MLLIICFKAIFMIFLFLLFNLHNLKLWNNGSAIRYSLCYRSTKPTLHSYRQQIVRNDWDMQITNQLRLGLLLELFCYKTRQKKSQPRNWFGKWGTYENSEWYQIDPYCMMKGVTHAHWGSIRYHSESSDVPYSRNQFFGWDFFCHFLQQDGSRPASARPSWLPWRSIVMCVCVQNGKNSNEQNSYGNNGKESSNLPTTWVYKHKMKVKIEMNQKTLPRFFMRLLVIIKNKSLINSTTNLAEIHPNLALLAVAESWEIHI